MFVSLNLFKSTNCPYYSSTTNVNTCERPYCQFRHGSNHAQYTSVQFNNSSIITSTTSNGTIISKKIFSIEKVKKKFHLSSHNTRSYSYMHCNLKMSQSFRRYFGTKISTLTSKPETH